jgi:hypothetical protein
MKIVDEQERANLEEYLARIPFENVREAVFATRELMNAGGMEIGSEGGNPDPEWNRYFLKLINWQLISSRDIYVDYEMFMAPGEE